MAARTKTACRCFGSSLPSPPSGQTWSGSVRHERLCAAVWRGVASRGGVAADDATGGFATGGFATLARSASCRSSMMLLASASAALCFVTSRLRWWFSSLARRHSITSSSARRKRRECFWTPSFIAFACSSFWLVCCSCMLCGSTQEQLSVLTTGQVRRLCVHTPLHPEHEPADLLVLRLHHLTEGQRRVVGVGLHDASPAASGSSVTPR